MRPRIVVLHIFSKGGIALNSESALDGQLAGRLREIYGTRAERVPYLSPEKRHSFPAHRWSNRHDPASSGRENRKASDTKRTSSASSQREHEHSNLGARGTYRFCRHEHGLLSLAEWFACLGCALRTFPSCPVEAILTLPRANDVGCLEVTSYLTPALLAERIAVRLVGARTHQGRVPWKTGYWFFAVTGAAADAVAVSFLYSALAWRSIGIFGSASFQVVKKSS
jgi:hypothetical protein